MYIAVLSAMVVLVFAAIASAQDSPEQYSSDQYGSDPSSGSSADPAQSPTAGQQEATTSGQPTPTQNTPTVSIGTDAFDPSQVEVASGTPVTFVNGDTVAHTVSLDGLFDSPEIPAGYSYPVTLDGSGTVTYHDKANPEMKGTIIVGGASQQEATTPAQSTAEPSQTAGETTQTVDVSGQPG
jgi:plastocyanin